MLGVGPSLQHFLACTGFEGFQMGQYGRSAGVIEDEAATTATKVAAMAMFFSCCGCGQICVVGVGVGGDDGPAAVVGMLLG